MTTRLRNHWLHVAIAFALLVVIALGIVTCHNFFAIRQSEQLVTRSYAIREAARELLSDIKDMQTGQRGYLLTKEPSYLQPYETGIQTVESSFDRLRKLTNEDVSQHERLDKLFQIYEAKRDHLAKTIELRKQQSAPETNAPYLELVLSGRGQKLMNEIRAVISEILHEEKQRLTEREKAASQQAAISQSSLIAGNAIALSLLLLTSVIAHVDRKKRDQAEAEIRSSRADLRAIFDSASDGIISFNADLSIRFMNPAATRMHACDAESVLGRSLLEFVPTGSRAAAEQEIRQFLASSDPVRSISETTALRDDGIEFPCAGSLAKSVVGNSLLATFTFRDLSETKASQAKIQQQTAILNQVRDAILVCDMNDRIIFWNLGSQILYGLSAEQAVGADAAELLFSRQRELWEEGRQEMLEQGTYRAEMAHHVHRDEEIVVEHRRTLIRNEHGAPAAQLILNLDITDLKQDEARRRRSQRLESIGTLAGGIAHDLNNVLTPILMSGKLLKRGSGNQERLTDAIVSSAERGSQMIKKLLSFAGGEQAVQQNIDIREILMEVEEILSHSLPKTIDVQVRAPGNLYPVCGDATELSQVLMNLAINARDAMPNGGRLEITADNIHVDESLVRQNHALCPGPHVLLTVVDNGIGMTQEIMDRIFDPFFTTKEQGKGTGLGLATTLGIVRSHGGEINVYSERGNGTSFSIYLPSSQVPVGAIIESRDGNGVQRGNGETILVVDDDALIVETACATLETGGYGALAAAGGAEGLSTYLRQSDLIDLVLLDMMMPGMDGVTAKERLRAINPDVCIVASSGLRRPRDAGERMADVDGFLPKPYSDDQLLELVRKVLDKKRETTGFK